MDFSKIERIYRRFQGMYGIDELTKALLMTAMVLSVVALLFGSTVVLILSILSGAYAILRIPSKNKYNRQKELKTYQKIKGGFNNFTKSTKNLFQSKKSKKSKEKDVVYEEVDTIVQCENCEQRLKVPANKKMKVTCTKCNHKFVVQT